MSTDINTTMGIALCPTVIKNNYLSKNTQTDIQTKENLVWKCQFMPELLPMEDTCCSSWLWICTLTISCSSQCSMTGVTMAMVCVILSGMVHIKDPLLLIERSSPCSGGSGFSLLLSAWSLTICSTPHNCVINVLSASLNKTFPSFLYVKQINWLRRKPQTLFKIKM